jgi:hypothetical protein
VSFREILENKILKNVIETKIWWHWLQRKGVIFGEISENKNIPMTWKTQTLFKQMVDTLDHSSRNMLQGSTSTSFGIIFSRSGWQKIFYVIGRLLGATSQNPYLQFILGS